MTAEGQGIKCAEMDETMTDSAMSVILKECGSK